MFKRFYSSLGACFYLDCYCVYGLGIWALVVQQLVNHASTTIIMWFMLNGDLSVFSL